MDEELVVDVAPAFGHVEVEEHHIGAMALDLPEHFFPGRGLCNDRDVPFGLRGGLGTAIFNTLFATALTSGLLALIF
ncbi:hypothetical protein [Nocardiopsis alba]|uniref:hypothetical protein n=1 Tax=Nocardiopsis alba TaxID=53437 RepID=UPI0033BC2B9D